jgi:hypothetical protein
MAGAVKSAFPKIAPRVDPELRAKLPPSATAAPSPHISPARSTTKQQPQPSNGAGNVAAKGTLGEPIKIEVELWLEVADAPDKHCPAYGYISQGQDPQRIVAVLNKSHWPVPGALARNDGNALRWLTALSVMDRCGTWRSHPVLAATRRYLTETSLGRWSDYQAGLWAAYKLKDNPLLARVPELISNSMQPQKFGEISVTVDSMKLEAFRDKMARRFRKRPLQESTVSSQVGAGENAA